MTFKSKILVSLAALLSLSALAADNYDLTCEAKSGNKIKIGMSVSALSDLDNGLWQYASVNDATVYARATPMRDGGTIGSVYSLCASEFCSKNDVYLTLTEKKDGTITGKTFARVFQIEAGETLTCSEN